MRPPCVAIQLRFEMEKTQRLTERLDELRRDVTNERLALQKKLAKREPTEEEEQEIDELRSKELDLNMVNFLRALITASMDKMLDLPDDKLIAAIRASHLPRGRPKDEARLAEAAAQK